MKTLATLWIVYSCLALMDEQAVRSPQSNQRQQARVKIALPPSRVDFAGFLKDSSDVEQFRAERLIDIDTFLRMAQDTKTILLDTRSKAAFDKKHLWGAVHLNFSDFTPDKLASVIPSMETRVLIYCNNNIAGDQANFAMKNITLALNIPTFINLYGYGYRDLYELSSLVPVDDARLKFAGTDVPDECK